MTAIDGASAGAAFTAAALDPRRSAVVDACAGSGKTWLLVSRMIRLLLDGADPSGILAITFTRKAAQEMRARLVDWLRWLAIAPDDQVTVFLRERAVPEQDLAQAMNIARGLFELCLAAQPGITIDTFHGWFLQLLERAPLNAGDGSIPRDFVLEERVSFLIDEAWDLFGALLQEPEHAGIASHFEALAAELGFVNLRRLLGRFLAKRAEWWAYTHVQADPVGFALAELRTLLAVDPDQDPLRPIGEDRGLRETLELLALVPAGKGKAQNDFAAALDTAVAETDPRRRYDLLRAACYTQKGQPRQHLTKFYENQPATSRDAFEGLCETLASVCDALAEREVYRLHERALPCAARLLGVFQDLKRARQTIDFTDIEWHAFRLLSDGGDAAFMHAKLDAQYRHILLDEFQDTNPLQWQALRAWLDAYGAEDGRPTVFMVGDPKQSIYRFRRAEPRLFGVAASVLATDYGATRLATDETRRCAPAIVDVVNAMFLGAPDFPGFPRHVSLAGAVRGRVEVLPLSANPQAAPSPAATAWRDPLREPLPERVDLRRAAEAAQLASRIRELVGRWEVPVRNAQDGRRMRPARYTDVLILKRTRTHLEAYEHALRVEGIPFLTSRHGGLLGTLEAADLCALIEVLISPFDDLKLAHALRCPIFGCQDEDLIRLAGEHRGTTPGPVWWARLDALVKTQSGVERAADERLIRAQRLLASWRAAADTAPVHDLLDRIYHEGDVLARYRAAVPPPLAGRVTANLNRFLELALELDSGRYPSLPRFVAELAGLRGAPDQEAPDEGAATGDHDFAGDGIDAVRICTIHGAKGLEAPVVWLIDAREGARADGYDVLVDWPPEAPGPRHFSLHTVSAARGRRRDGVYAAQDALSERERLNLWYVAATRAQHYLFVSGVETERAPGASLAQNAYDRVASAVSALAPGERVIGEAALIDVASSSGAKADTLRASIPPAVLAMGNVGNHVRETPEARAGTLLHALLEHASAPGEPGAVEQSAMLRRELSLSEQEFAPLWRQAQSILAAPGMRRFFEPARYRRAENELELMSGGELRRIDRMVEFDDEVWILDYKSGVAGGIAAWRAQLAAYRDMLRPLYPGKAVRAAVVLADGGLEELGG